MFKVTSLSRQQQKKPMCHKNACDFSWSVKRKEKSGGMAN